ncbi:MotE family protein [Sphingosinithalassobacter sp. LHW66-3]|uniref:MotE family protein n=1 Tax=Sphingosinithalassobacter sp. LHW66-3 TaxID=3424718 RepID=UPI003D6B165C
MIPRPSLLLLTAAASALAVVANGVTAATPEPQAQSAPAASTRLGNEIEQDLSARDAAAARRRRALDLREQAARAAEARLQAQMGAQQQQQPAAAGANPEAPPEGAQFDELARIYQAMKPGKAAVVFEQLELDVQMQIAQRMRERSTAQILAAMTPQGAAALSMALARGRADAGQAMRRPQPQTRPR